MPVRVIVRRGEYRDSITLMKASNEISRMKGVRGAAVVMGTETNMKLLRDMGLYERGVGGAGQNDLVIAIEAEDSAIVNKAIASADRILTPGEQVRSAQTNAQSIEEALGKNRDANFVMISVPGEFAPYEAKRAIEHGLNVFLFSSNVPIAEEVRLKRVAHRKGLLVMGPDCGTAIVNGSVLGFGNAVSRGPVGIVSASGTGLQQVSTLLDAAGVGISQAIGTGSNDLSRRVGGTTMLDSLRLLAEDASTKIIVLVSKPPDPSVSSSVLRAAAKCGKPVIAAFLGADPRMAAVAGCVPASNLEEAAALAAKMMRGRRNRLASSLGVRQLLASAKKEWQELSKEQRYIRGLYSGGTLCYEAQVVLGPFLKNLRSNAPLRRRDVLRDTGKSVGHIFIDMGSEEFVLGRAHPMIDFTLRKRRIVREANERDTAVLLLDVILGFGSNDDPAGELIPAIKHGQEMMAKKGGHLSTIVSLIGTTRDGQDLGAQRLRFEKAGVLVAHSNVLAAKLAATISSRGELEGGLFDS